MIESISGACPLAHLLRHKIVRVNSEARRFANALFFRGVIILNHFERLRLVVLVHPWLLQNSEPTLRVQRVDHKVLGGGVLRIGACLVIGSRLLRVH